MIELLTTTGLGSSIILLLGISAILTATREREP